MAGLTELGKHALVAHADAQGRLGRVGGEAVVPVGQLVVTPELGDIKIKMGHG